MIVGISVARNTPEETAIKIKIQVPGGLARAIAAFIRHLVLRLNPFGMVLAYRGCRIYMPDFRLTWLLTVHSPDRNCNPVFFADYQ